MEKWSYKLPPPVQIWDAQEDWNQTLMTKFNALSVGVNTEVTIKVPQNLKPLIESLSFYDSSSNKIGTRFNLEFVDTDNNIIYVGDSALEVENFELTHEI